MEYGFPEETVSELRRRGHQLSFEAPESAFGFGGAQLIHAIDGGYVAGSRPPQGRLRGRVLIAPIRVSAHCRRGGRLRGHDRFFC